ncbi:EAL and HDOD domain-containing protein [Aquipuribacter hungaricus]|uniref:EAL and HDOD domain-containing protein n=1 Tax=Aquipuribacter hungaricus TaxID=545624 RepID=A0ABV7WMM8_9MICO
MVDEAAHEAATAQVISAVFGEFGVANLAGDLPLFVNTTRAFLVGDIPLPDDPERLVIEVLEHVLLDAEVLAGIVALKRAGYRIAADDWDGTRSRDGLLPLCDVVKIDLSAVGHAALPGLIADARRLSPGVSVCVERVETAEDAGLAEAAGAVLLQGFYLDRPQTRTTRTLTASEVTCLRLLGALASEADTGELVRLVSSDPGLAMQVLRMAASPAGVGRPVASVSQAVVLLGPRKLGSWLVLVLLGGASRASREHVVAVLARAGACALLSPSSRDAAFTAGLLSAALELLGGEPADVMRDSGADPAIADAVLRGGGPVGAALQAVIAHERNDPAAALSTTHDPYTVSRAVLQAVVGARAVAEAMSDER